MSAGQTRLGAATTAPRDRTFNRFRDTDIATGRPFERLLSAHESATGYRELRTGKGARITCAVCGTKSYKVAVAEGADGTVLLHAFCGHTPHEVLSAIGLEMADLFPERIKDLSPEGRRAAGEALKLNGWAAALGVIARECTVIEVAAHDLAAGNALSVADHDRLLVACDRIHCAREILT